MTSAGAGPNAWIAYADAALRHLLEATGELLDDGDAEAEFEIARASLFGSLDVAEHGFTALAVNAHLDPSGCEVLAFVVACELDVRRQRIVDELQHTTGRGQVSLQTIGALLGGLDRCVAAFGPGSRLRRAALIDVSDDGPWAQQRVVVPAALIWAFLGDVAPDPDLPAPTVRVDTPEHGTASVVFAAGPDKVRRRQAAMAAADADRFLVAPVPASEREWSALVREATLTASGIVVELDGPLPPLGHSWIERADHVAWAITSTSPLPIRQLPSRPFRDIEVPPSELTEDEWAAAFGAETPRVHRLSPQQAEQVAKVFPAQDHDLDAAVRRLLSGPLETLAQRIRPRRGWADIVLPAASQAQLRAIVSRYRHSAQVYDRWGFSPIPSRGLVALFSGPSGSGKTLAAEVLAGELGLDMFKLDLSSVVSKYIGETEKNLDELFDAAGLGNVVLFFDEADALFGKRSEVRDARDRYANTEVSYLLQRVEDFDGVVVLATNFERSIDEAFLRRIHTRVEFLRPAAPERLQIWERHLPPQVPLGELDLEWLSRQFELSGAQIRNATVQAAFYASEESTAVTMDSLVRAVAQELRKAGRLLTPAEFGEWASSIAR